MSVKIRYLNEDLIENVDKNMFSNQLKENVSKKFNLNHQDVELKFGQIFLQDKKYVRKVLETNFILIHNNESISIKINDLTFVMEITMSHGRSVEIKNLTGEVTIEELKQKLSVQFNFDKKDTILKCENEKIMEDEKLLKDYIHVKTLDIVIKNKTKVRINIKDDDKNYYINAFKEMTGEELRKEINKKINMIIKNYTLEYNGIIIEANDTLNDHKIVDNDVIFVKNKTKVRILIRYDNRKFEINAFKEMTGEELRKEINKKVHTIIQNYTLEYCGKIIKDSETLNYHEIKDNGEIFTVAEVGGGD